MDRAGAAHLHVPTEPQLGVHARGAIGPTAAGMLRLVLDRELPLGELAQQTGVSQPATSQHLKVLRDAGLLRGRVEGRRRLYQLDLQGLQRLRAELDSLWEPALLALKQAAEASDRP